MSKLSVSKKTEPVDDGKWKDMKWQIDHIHMKEKGMGKEIYTIYRITNNKRVKANRKTI